MRGLSKKLILSAILPAILFGTGLPLVVSIPTANAASCSQWSLLDASSSLVTSFSPNQITFGNPLFSNDTDKPPAVPASAPEGSTWKCTVPGASAGILTNPDKQLAQGTVACQKAVQLSAKFGGFTALDASFSANIQKGVLDNITNFLKSKTSSATGINLDFKDIASSTGLTAAGDLVQSYADKLFINSLKQGVAAETQQVMDSAKQTLNEIIQQGAIAKGISEILDVNAVPTHDQGVAQKLDATNQNINNVIAQQKAEQVIQDTRDRCNDLLKTTGATIKKALLYQLSTQIVDWIQNGQAPQFVKQPGKFLEDTGKLALDRFISKVAPQLCQPFQFAIQVQIPTVAREANPFYEQVTCSLNQVTDNVENFYSDFRQGGWLTYQEMWKPQNNYYGALLMTQDAAAQTVAAATQAAKQDVSQGRGFTSQARCTEWSKFVAWPNPTDIEKSQSVQYDGVNYKIFDSAGPQDDGGPPETNLTQDQLRPYQFWDKDRTLFWECEKNEITNPGTVAANLSERASTVDLDYLVNTDDVENFLQTIQDSIVNKVVKSGVNGLRKLLPSVLPAIKP